MTPSLKQLVESLIDCKKNRQAVLLIRELLFEDDENDDCWNDRFNLFSRYCQTINCMEYRKEKREYRKKEWDEKIKRILDESLNMAEKIDESKRLIQEQSPYISWMKEMLATDCGPVKEEKKPRRKCELLKKKLKRFLSEW